MAEQSRKGKPKKEEEAPVEEKTASKDSKDVDELLDEIDELLEPQAEDFVRSFIQKGGQLWIWVAVSAAFLSHLAEKITLT